MDSKENHLDQSEVTWKRLFLMHKNKMKIEGKQRLSIVVDYSRMPNFL